MLFIFCISGVSVHAENASSQRTQFKVFLDVGHGGWDPGGTGPDGLPESFVNLAVANKLAAILHDKGILVELDRTGNTYVSLARRVALADASGANLFLGLYCNASSDRSIHGTTTYYYHPGSQAFARYLEDQVARGIGLSNDGIMKDDLYVIKNTTDRMPDVLIEYAYISNHREEGLLASPPFQDHIASAIAEAIENYFTHQGGTGSRQDLTQSATPATITSIVTTNGTVRIESVGRPTVGSFRLKEARGDYFVITLENTILAGHTRSFWYGPPFSGRVTVGQYTNKPEVVRVSILEDYDHSFVTETDKTADGHYVTIICPMED